MNRIEDTLKLNNVVGFSRKIFKRIKNGVEVNEDCIRIYLSEKLPESQLSRDQIVPKRIRNMSTDCVEIGVIKALDATDHVDPVVAGVSIGHKNITAGTNGGVVWKDGESYLISNNHVFADTNKANIGDEIIQPGRYDGGILPRDKVGELADFVELLPEGNVVDVAIVKPTRNFLPETIMIDGNNISVPYRGVTEVNRGDKVWKVGRTTGLTRGIIEDPSITVQVLYSHGDVKVFEDCTLTIPDGFPHWIAGGDSGSLVLTENNKIAGIAFAGSSTHGIECKAVHIESKLGVKFMPNEVKTYLDRASASVKLEVMVLTKTILEAEIENDVVIPSSMVTIRGSLKNKETGECLAGKILELYIDNDQIESPHLGTDKDGNFEYFFKAPKEPGMYTVRVVFLGDII